VKTVSVYDMTGKKVDVKWEGTTVDVRNLVNGAYMITVETSKETQSQKFIKK
jgi:hypothetical protein